MRRNLGTVLILTATLCGLAGLAGCGGDGGAEAVPAPSPGSASAGSDYYLEPTLVSQTAAGGRVTRQVTVLDDEQAVKEYAGRFRSDAMGAKVTRAAAQIEVPEGQHLVAAIVAVGCDVPPGVKVTGSGADAVLTPEPVPTPMSECLAPVTTVALAVVPESA